MRLSIVIPVLNEAGSIVDLLQSLAALRKHNVALILADGGSTDGTCALAAPYVDLVVVAAKGRATQMNAGAAAAPGDVFLFLHADTRLPANALDAIGRVISQGAAWGRFDVAIEGPRWSLRVVAGFMNLRSRITGIATGDQAIFVTRAAFDAVGTFPEIALMEDIALSTLLNQHFRPACLAHRVTTSGRRWERNGVLRTILLMWRLRLAYYFGVDPQQLAHQYSHVRSHK